MLILLGVGLFIQSPFISAQESGAAEQEAQTEQTDENALRIAEQAFTFTSENNTQTTTQGSSVWVIIRMLLVLALAALAIYGIVYFLKKKSAGETSLSDPFLKVLANSHLGNNRYAHIVSVGNKAWLLGSSDGGVNLIGEIDDKEIINAMLLEDSKRAAEAASSRMPDFRALLRKLGAPVDKRTPDAEELRKHRERLKEM